MAAGVQVVPLDLVEEDDIGGWNGLDTFTVDRPGWYLVTGAIDWLVLASAARSRISVRHNALDVPLARPPSLASALMGTGSRWVMAQTGDTFKLTGSRHPSLSSTVTNDGTFFSVVRLGPLAWT